MNIKTNEDPKVLYKILTLENWQASEKTKNVVLSAEDDAFIHLATEDQVQKIIAKYFADVPKVVILKIDTSKLQGRLVYEANPFGTTKYFHLYEGAIPLDSVIESKTQVNRPKL